MKEKRQIIFIDFEFTMPERNVRMKEFYRGNYRGWTRCGC